MELEKIKDSESDSRPTGEARNRTSLRERITSLFHNKKTKRNPKMDHDLDSLSIQSGWSDSTLADTEIPSSSSGQIPRRHRQLAPRHQHRNAGKHSVDAGSLAVNKRRDGPESSRTSQGRGRDEDRLSGAQAEPGSREDRRGKTARSRRTNGSTISSQRGYGSLSNTSNRSLIPDTRRLQTLTPMRRRYDVYDFNERYGRGFDKRYGRDFEDKYGRTFGDRYAREGSIDGDNFYDGDDGIDDEDEYDDVAIRTICHSGQGTPSCSGRLQITQT